jgi:PBP1b-binding outer membrane lipoprotein LpoB
MKSTTRLTVGAAVLTVLCAGCYTPPSSPYVPAQERGVTTVQMDEKDYQMAAFNITQRMLKRKLPKNYVVALGPVDTRGTPYPVDVVKLQDKIESIMDEEGTLRFTSAVDAMSGDRASAEIYKLIEYNWWHNNPMDQEDMDKFGRLANVNGLLFGRVSSIERPMDGGGTEITYTFAWRLVNTQTGVNDMTLVDEIRKNIVPRR